MRWSVSGLRPSFVRLVTQQWHRSESGLWARLRTAIRRILRHRQGPSLGSGCPGSRSGPIGRRSATQSRDGPNLLHFRYTTRSGSVTGILLGKSARQPPSLARQRSA